MPKISVIVPVYNTEKYLNKCIDSIVNQTYKDLEIIIVNDGSTDNSIKIIKEYSEKYPNIIQYFEKENGGLSSARNYGIEKATGEYISFVDSDDYLDLNLYESLIEQLDNNIDLVKFKLIRITQQNNEIDRIDGPTFIKKNGEDAFNSIAFHDVLLEPACIYIFKRELIKDERFELNRYHEDFGLIPIIILKSKTVSSMNYYGYYYVQSDKSITRNDSYDNVLKGANDLLYHYDNMTKRTKEFNLTKKTQENVYLYYTNAILSRRAKLKKIDRKEYDKSIKNRKMTTNIKIKGIKSLIKKAIVFFELYL